MERAIRIESVQWGRNFMLDFLLMPDAGLVKQASDQLGYQKAAGSNWCNTGMSSA